MVMTMSQETPSFYRMRPLSSKDIAALAAWFENANDLTIFDRNGPIPVGPEALEAIWRANLDDQTPRASYWFAIDDASEDVVGLAGLQSINYLHGDAVIPVFLSPMVRRIGLGVRTTAHLIDLAFDQLRLHRLTSYYRADNLASKQLTEKLGFVTEGYLRNAWYSRGQHFDVTIIGILKEEWINTRSAFFDSLDPTTVVLEGP